MAMLINCLTFDHHLCHDIFGSYQYMFMFHCIVNSCLVWFLFVWLVFLKQCNVSAPCQFCLVWYLADVTAPLLQYMYKFVSVRKWRKGHIYNNTTLFLWLQEVKGHWVVISILRAGGPTKHCIHTILLVTVLQMLKILWLKATVSLALASRTCNIVQFWT